MIESVASWFTPTVLFCFLNLMIGTILITSSLKTEKTKQTQLINRSPSLLHRVKSINLSFPDPLSSITHDFSDNSPQQLDRAPSLLQRVKSINLSFSRLELPDPIPSVAQYNEEQVQKVDAIEPQIANQEEGAGSHVTISKSSTCPARVQTRTMVKSASEKKIPVSVAEVDVDLQRPATTRETVPYGEDEAVDRKADDFINKFRQQLKLQRLDSILRYKEMLNRGVGR